MATQRESTWLLGCPRGPSEDHIVDSLLKKTNSTTWQRRKVSTNPLEWNLMVHGAQVDSIHPDPISLQWVTDCCT